MRNLLVRHNFIFILLLLLITPNILNLVGLIFGQNCIPSILQPGYKLCGFTNKHEDNLQVNVTQFRAHHLQTYVENYLTDQLPLRSFLIRLNNQIYYTFFKKSYSYAGNIIIGNNKQLIELPYITSYTSQQSQNNPTTLLEWADKLKIIHDYYKKKNKTFVYVITPSKVEYRSSIVPKRFQCNQTGICNYITELAKLLDERNVPYINGSKLMINATEKYGVEMFPRGGIHWNNLAALLATNVLIEKINQSKFLHINPLDFTFKLTHDVDERARDLLNLSNLLFPPLDYLVPKIFFVKRKNVEKPLVISMIGGSFCESIAEILANNEIASKVTVFSYLVTAELVYVKDDFKINKPEPDAILAKIDQADIIIVEGNSIASIPGHGSQFFELLNEHMKNNK
jgi:alginate O-acetyltransferase complex protein AlgJ